MEQRCEGRTELGYQCQRSAMRESTHCWHHRWQMNDPGNMPEWILWARRKPGPGAYDGTWQPRRQGSLKECHEDMLENNLAFDAFWLVFGTWDSHERPS